MKLIVHNRKEIHILVNKKNIVFLVTLEVSKMMND